MRGNQRGNAAAGDADETDSSHQRSTAREAVISLQTETEVGDDDYDPTQDVVEDSLAVFPQGQLEGSSLGGQVTVEKVDNENDRERAR